jgi:CBS domain-containing protein
MRRQLLTRLPSRRLVLGAETALDLMVPDALTLPAALPLREAARILTERGISAAPVVDDGGRPVGVLSRADIVRQESATEEAGPGPTAGKAAPRVADVMTPVVLSLRQKTPANAVVDALLSLDVHQLFVTDEVGDVIGVVRAKDILRHLQLEPPEGGASTGRQGKS